MKGIPMINIHRGKWTVTTHVCVVGALALVGLPMLGILPSKGAKLSTVLKGKADHFPIVMVADDIKHDVTGKVLAIDPDTPGLITRVLTGVVGPVSYLEWTEDHQYLLLSSARGLFLCRYDRLHRSFDPAVAVTNPGMDSAIRWPAGMRPRERDIESALRLKVVQERHVGPGQTLAWSPDHTQIAFTIPSKEVADSAGEVYQELWVAKIDGLQLKHIGHGAHPSWSPDGRYLVAIDGSDLGGKRILRYDLNHHQKQILRSGHLDCFAIAQYSANGDAIAVFGASDPADEISEGVFLLNKDGRLLRSLARQKSIGLISYPVVLVW